MIPMPQRFILIAQCLFSFALMAGCSMTTTPLSKEQFTRRVEVLLSGHDSVVVEARALTEFSWETLCFERSEALQLKFKRTESEEVLLLPYEEFYVDEGHVPHSLEDACVLPNERILVRKKYPGYQGPIEFQRVDQGG